MGKARLNPSLIAHWISRLQGETEELDPQSPENSFF
jgi:hypothetical protein